MKRILISLIRCYQVCISRFTAAHCRFTPTCSAYAIEAIELHGALKGSALAAWRILRCNPFCRGGYDPVPEPSRKRRGDKGGSPPDSAL